MSVELHHGDCLEVLRAMPDNSVDSVVTDPPYGLGFMGKEWDDLPPGKLWADECLRVLKPGGHLLAFGGTRTSHRLACAIEDAGFEIRDSIAWLYGSGFPKSLDVSKAIDKARDDKPARAAVGAWLRAQRIAADVGTRELCAAIGAHGERNNGGAVSNWELGLACPTWEQWDNLRRALGFGGDMDAEVWRLNGRKGSPGDDWQNAEVIGVREGAMAGWSMDGTTRFVTREDKAPATDPARTWQGWGTALKPAHEPIVVARKPLAGTVAANVLQHGTGALNIDATRVEGQWSGGPNRASAGAGLLTQRANSFNPLEGTQNPAGRWPANVVLDESQAAALDEQSGELHAPGSNGSCGIRRPVDDYGLGAVSQTPGRTDKGGASRFFFIAREDSTCETQSPANIAGQPSSQPSAPDDSAPSDAATSAHHDTAKQTPSASTSERESESRPSGEGDTQATPTTGGKSLPELPLLKPFPNGNRASSAEPKEPIDTTTTTTSHSTSDGSADLATSDTTSQSREPGDLDSLSARFRYQAKAPKSERPVVDGVAHATVKPLALMRWLVRLVTPPGGVVLEPFAGSGTTVEAALLEGFRVVAIEREADYLPLIEARIARVAARAAQVEPDLFTDDEGDAA